MSFSRPAAILFEPIGTLLVEAHQDVAAGLGLAPAPDAHDLLDELAADQVQLAVVSDADCGARALAAELERHGLRRPFPCIVSSVDLGRPKPDPAAFQEALRRLRVPAERAWHVGGAFASDVLGAAAAGLQAVWLVREPEPAPGPAPHQRVASLAALLGLYLESQRTRP